MKKVLSFALVLVVAFSLTACKSKELKETEKLIKAIGEVTLESGDAIAKAEEAFNELSEDDQDECKNADDLEDAREAYDKLVEEDSIKKVEDAINAIGTVDMNSIKAIEAAQDAYDALDSDVKAKVKNADKLDSMKAEYKALKRQNAEGLLANLKLDHDRVRNLKFYYPSTLSFYSNGKWGADIRCFIMPYIGLDDDSSWLRLIYNYTGDDWVFFDSVLVNVDGKQYSDSYNYFDVTRDNGGGDVWEYIDEEATASDIEMLRAIVDSNETIIRFQGDDFSHDFTVNAADKAAIKELLDAYDALN